MKYSRKEECEMIAAKRIDEVEESTDTKKLNIRIEAPTATMIPNKFFDDSKKIVDDIGIRGYAILLIVAKNEFAIFKESDLSINQISDRLGIEFETTKEYCIRMERKRYIKMDGDFIQL